MAQRRRVAAFLTFNGCPGAVGRVLEEDLDVDRSRRSEDAQVPDGALAPDQKALPSVPEAAMICCRGRAYPGWW
jgi:hypothetical protein